MSKVEKKLEVGRDGEGKACWRLRLLTNVLLARLPSPLSTERVLRRWWLTGGPLQVCWREILRYKLNIASSLFPSRFRIHWEVSRNYICRKIFTFLMAKLIGQHNWTFWQLSGLTPFSQLKPWGLGTGIQPGGHRLALHLWVQEIERQMGQKEEPHVCLELINFAQQRREHPGTKGCQTLVFSATRSITFPIGGGLRGLREGPEMLFQNSPLENRIDIPFPP